MCQTVATRMVPPATQVQTVRHRVFAATRFEAAMMELGGRRVPAPLTDPA